jgi:hypothetical protein
MQLTQPQFLFLCEQIPELEKAQLNNSIIAASYPYADKTTREKVDAYLKGRKEENVIDIKDIESFSM